MIMSPGEAQQVLTLYPSLSRRDRLMILARLIFCARPIMQVLEQHLPDRGLILDLGCGYGVMSHLVSTEYPHRAVMGFDMSSRRIEVAKRSVNGRGNMEFHTADIREIRVPRCDAVIMIDVLSMLSYQDQIQLLARCYEKLRDGGVLVVKDTCKSPYWKYAYVYVEDMLKTKLRVFGKEITKHSLHFSSVQEFVKLLEGVGFRATASPLKSRLPYPGVFYVCQK